MFDQSRISLMLTRIEEAISLIQNNTKRFLTADDYLCSQDGMFALSGVCMQLISSHMSIITLMPRRL